MADFKSKDHESNETAAGSFCDEASNFDLFYGRTLRHPEIEEMFSGPSIAADALRSATGRWLAPSNMARTRLSQRQLFAKTFRCAEGAGVHDLRLASSQRSQRAPCSATALIPVEVDLTPWVAGGTERAVVG